MRKALIWPLVLTVWVLASCRTNPVDGHLELSITSSQKNLAAGDTLTLQVAVTNTGEKPIGFYARDVGSLVLVALDAQGEQLPYHTLSAQRAMPSPYPDEYFLLAPGQIWVTELDYPLRWGKIEDFLEPASKFQLGTPTVIHAGYYFDLWPHSDGPDHILITRDHGETIQLAVQFSASDPNPRGYDRSDCVSAGIPLDVLYNDSSPNRILHSVMAFETVSTPVEPMQADLRAWEETMDLAMYCQQITTLSRPAWIGTLQSNRIFVKIGQWAVAYP